MTSINLIPPAHRQNQRLRARRANWQRSLRIYLVIMLGVALASQISVLSASNTQVVVDIEHVRKRLATTIAERDALRARVSQLGNQLDAARAVGEHPDWAAALTTIAVLRGDDIALESLDLSSTRSEPERRTNSSSTGSSASSTSGNASQVSSRSQFTLKLVGAARSPGAVFLYARRLEDLGVFDRVAVKDTRSTTLGTASATRFELEAVVSDQAGTSAKPSATASANASGDGS